MTTAQAKAFLLSLLPPGFTRWWDFSAGSFADQIYEVAAAALVDEVATPTEWVEAVSNPWTLPTVTFSTVLISRGLHAWEVALGIANDRVARYGTPAARKAAIIARFRENGAASTLDNIKSIVGPLLGYENPLDLEIIETPRADLTTENSYTNITGVSFVGGGAVIQGVAVTDDGIVSQMGVQLILTNPAISDLDDFRIVITGPDAATKTWEGEVLFRDQPNPLYLYGPEFAGAQINGNWGVDFISDAGDFSCDEWTLFVEGIGRVGIFPDPVFPITEGYGAEIFKFAVVVDPDLAGVTNTADYAAALVAISRVKPAHTAGYLVSRMSDGSLCAICDDPFAVADGCVCC